MAVIDTVIQNTADYNLVKDNETKKQVIAQESQVVDEDENLSSSDDEEAAGGKVTRKYRNDTQVFRLSRTMVRDYKTAKGQVRHFTPDLGNRRVAYGNPSAATGQPQTKKEQDELILVSEEDAQSRIECEMAPKFRSAYSTPY